ncbi:hypothetical protein C1646_725799, partial [Rhizophagus diaphanus]
MVFIWSVSFLHFLFPTVLLSFVSIVTFISLIFHFFFTPLHFFSFLFLPKIKFISRMQMI